jgi:hypothetical protein
LTREERLHDFDEPRVVELPTVGSCELKVVGDKADMSLSARHQKAPIDAALRRERVT